MYKLKVAYTWSINLLCAAALIVSGLLFIGFIQVCLGNWTLEVNGVAPNPISLLHSVTTPLFMAWTLPHALLTIFLYFSPGCAKRIPKFHIRNEDAAAMYMAWAYLGRFILPLFIWTGFMNAMATGSWPPTTTWDYVDIVMGIIGSIAVSFPSIWGEYEKVTKSFTKVDY